MTARIRISKCELHGVDPRRPLHPEACQPSQGGWAHSETDCKYLKSSWKSLFERHWAIRLPPAERSPPRPCHAERRRGQANASPSHQRPGNPFARRRGRGKDTLIYSRYNGFAMQVLQAGQHKLIFLELQPEMVASIARQAGFDTRAKDGVRSIQLDLSTPQREPPLLLFDAADPANLGWFSRCQFYVDGRSGAIMQTPMTLANKRDRGGRAHRHSVRLVISKELPASFRLPGKQPLTEQVFYHLFFNFLSALTNSGVAVCGGGVVEPLAGRGETVGSRN
jgi:hypothetical protein